MRKLKLDLDRLEVASFLTVDGPEGTAGTVHALSFTGTDTGSASECNTYDESCVHTYCACKTYGAECSVPFTTRGTDG